MRDHTDGSWGVGFIAEDLDRVREEFELAADSAPVVELFWGKPDLSAVEAIHQGGGLAFWQVGSVGEALAAADAGCDAVVAQGIEAGGHVRGTLPLLAFLDALVPKVTLPVVAAGGIASGRSIAAALAAGASAVIRSTRPGRRCSSWDRSSTWRSPSPTGGRSCKPVGSFSPTPHIVCSTIPRCVRRTSRSRSRPSRLRAGLPRRALSVPGYRRDGSDRGSSD